LVGNLCAPPFGLLVKVLPIRERATRQKVSFHVGEVSLYFCLPVCIADDMGDEGDPEDLAEAFHLRGNICLRAAAVSHKDARIVDDTPRADAIHELKGRIEKDPGLEAGEGRVILDKKSSGVSEDQPRTLGLHLLSTQKHNLGGSIVLHLLPRSKRIGSGTMFSLLLPQIEVAYDPGQGTIGNAVAVLVLEDLLNPDHIALGGFEGLMDDGGNLLEGGFSKRCLLPLPPDDPSDRVSRDFEDLADLPDLHAPLIKALDGLFALLGDHRD